MLKEIYNREYSSISDFADLKAFRFHIKKEDKVKTIVAIRDLFYGNDILLNMKQKGVVVSQDEIADLKKKKINIA
jgi:hypothetical protein